MAPRRLFDRIGPWVLLLAFVLGCQRQASRDEATDKTPLAPADAFDGVVAGKEREAGGVILCWCPAGRFRMGSPHSEPERRPGEDQVEVTLTKGFWMGKFEVTQKQWREVMGEFPGKLNAGEGDEFPVWQYVNLRELAASKSVSF